jgi:hypothetical protein
MQVSVMIRYSPAFVPERLVTRRPVAGAPVAFKIVKVSDLNVEAVILAVP